MKKKILIVDDEEIILDAVSLVLKMAGYEVETAKNGHEAFNKINVTQMNGNPFDLLLLDIIMPGMDGIGLIKKLDHENMLVPFIMLSGHGDKNTLMELLRLGCEDFIYKPFQPDSLVQHIHSYFDKQLTGSSQ